MLFCFLSSGAFASGYYLDSSASGTGDGLTLINAFTTFDEVDSSAFGSGDTLWISGGAVSKQYDLTETYTPPSGTTFKVNPDTNHNGIVIIDGGDVAAPLINLVNKSNITIDGEVDGQKHIRLQNWNWIAVSGYGTGSVITGTTLRYLEMINDDLTCSEGCLDPPVKKCIYLSKLGGDSLIEHNYLEGCVREAIVAGRGGVDSLTTYDDNIIQYNEIKGYRDEQGRGGPDGVKGGGNSTIRYNKIYHEELASAEYNPSHPAEDGIQILSSYAKVYGNEVYGYSQGPIRADGPALNSIFIYNNLLYATDVYGLQRGIQLDLTNYYNVHVYNNTIVGFKTIGINVSTRSETLSADVKVYNNILVDCPMVIDTDGDTSLLDVDYNLCLNEDYSNKGCGTQTNDPYDSNKSFSFTSYTLGATDNDFTLPSTATMAIGAGTNLSTYFTDDLEGNTRSGWDLGAYDSGTSLPVTVNNALFLLNGSIFKLKDN